MTHSGGSGPDFARLEADAKLQAVKHVANMLQRPDQLEKVDQIQRRVARRKASCEAMLKTAVQSQLDGVRTGLQQLRTALTDCQLVEQSLVEIEKIYEKLKPLQERLKPLREENGRHRQLAAAVQNLQHIFNVPELVVKTEELINDGKLLHAHKNLTDLENARDDLLLELLRQPGHNEADKQTLLDYFARVEGLSNALGKQLWLILKRTLSTVRRQPGVIVTALRIIEREEARDSEYLERQAESSFLPPGRPKRWRQRCFDVLQDAVKARIEGSQLEDREQTKMWLVRHLENMRIIVLDDLKVVKGVCTSCFPPHYDITNRMVIMYHTAIREHVEELAEDVDGNEIVSLLTWASQYTEPELMGSPELKIDVSQLQPLLSTENEQLLKGRYLENLRTDLQKWMRNTLIGDKKDWIREAEPEKDNDGFYQTSLSFIIFQMFEQSLQVANKTSPEIGRQALLICAEAMTSFTKTYSDTIREFRAAHLQDREAIRFFIPYMVAVANNCERLGQFDKQFEERCESLDEQTRSITLELRQKFDAVAYAACQMLTEEVLLDLESHFKDLLTRAWFFVPEKKVVCGTICLTVEDYAADFRLLRPRFYAYLHKRLQTQICARYLTALCSKRVVFKKYEERKEGVEQLVKDQKDLEAAFRRVAPDEEEQTEVGTWTVLGDIAELLKLRDTSMMSLELSGLVQKHPSIRGVHLINLLQMREDVDKSEAKEHVITCFGEDFITKARPSGIFTDIAV